MSRKIMNMRMLNIKVQDPRKDEKLNYRLDKLKLGIDFFNNCKQLGVFAKFFIFKLPKISNHDTSPAQKRLLCSNINKNKNKF